MRTAEQRAAHAANMRLWRIQNPEKARATQRRSREKRKTDPDRQEQHRAYQRQAQKEWNAAHPEQRKAIARKAELLARHGLSVEQYDAMVEAQEGLCLLCHQPPAEGRRLSVDHDHECCPGPTSCGKCIRGLLCDACNGALGLFRDSIETLERAIAYLNGRWVTA